MEQYVPPKGYNLFSAFFLFSAPVAPVPVAARFTALVPDTGVFPGIPTPTLATFASAVPRGEGEVCRSLVTTGAPSLPATTLDGDDVNGRG